MDINGLEYFIKAAETLNFTKAANECQITQTAMSQHINNMETVLGFRLFSRTTRKVSLTPAGEAFYIRIKQLLADYSQAVQYSADVASGKISTIQVSIPSAMEGSVIMPRFQCFQERYPDVELEIRIQSTVSIAHQLNNGLYDVAISWPYEFDRTITHTYSIAEFELDVLCSAQHHLAKKTSLTLSDISSEKLFAVNLTKMPHTRFNMERMWADLGHTMPDLSVKHNVYTIEEIILRIQLDPAIIVLVPTYCKRFIPDTYRAVPLDAPLKFQLTAAAQRDDPRPEIMRLIRVLSDPRVPLDF